MHAKLERSDIAPTQSAAEQVDSADRRTELAAGRTILAAERTYAAWVPTGRAAPASGIRARALLDEPVADRLSKTTGAMLVLAAGFWFVAGVWRVRRDGDDALSPRTAARRSARAGPARSA